MGNETVESSDQNNDILINSAFEKWKNSLTYDRGAKSVCTRAHCAQKVFEISQKIFEGPFFSVS